MDTMDGQPIRCSDCGEMFSFSDAERAFYEERGLQFPPKRCKSCRQARKMSQRDPRDRGGPPRGRSFDDRGGPGGAGGGFQRGRPMGGDRDRFSTPSTPSNGGGGDRFEGPRSYGGDRGDRRPQGGGGFGGGFSRGGSGGQGGAAGGFRGGAGSFRGGEPGAYRGERPSTRPGGWGPPRPPWTPRAGADGQGYAGDGREPAHEPRPAPQLRRREWNASDEERSTASTSVGERPAPSDRPVVRDRPYVHERPAARPRPAPRSYDADRPRDGADRAAPRKYSVVCQECGTNATVPFEPVPGREIFCPPCYRARRGIPEREVGAGLGGAAPWGERGRPRWPRSRGE